MSPARSYLSSKKPNSRPLVPLDTAHILKRVFFVSDLFLISQGKLGST